MQTSLYKNRLDAVYGIVLLISAVIILWMLLADSWWQWRVRWLYPYRPLMLPFAAVLPFVFVTRWQLLHSRVRWWGPLGTALATLLAILSSDGWWTGPMHDIALTFFDSHGHFGCGLDDDCWFRAQTAPWILFSPLLGASCLYLARTIPERWMHWLTTYERGPGN